MGQICIEMLRMSFYVLRIILERRYVVNENARQPTTSRTVRVDKGALSGYTPWHGVTENHRTLFARN